MPESEARGGADERTHGRKCADRLTQFVFAPMIAADVAAYARARDLPKLTALSPHELADGSIAGTERIAAKLASLARAQHALGLRGHWSYDLNRAFRPARGAESRAGPSRPSSQRAGPGAARGGGGMNRLLLTCAFLFLLWRICAPAEPDFSPARDSAVFPAVEEARR